MKMSLKFHVDLHLICTYTVLIVTTGTLSVLIILQQKDYLLESPLNLLVGVYSTSFHVL